MNFDRKFGNSHNVAAKDNKNFAELPPLSDKAPQRQNAAEPAPHYRDAARDMYPSGAFPALDAAYSEYNMQNGAGEFTSEKDFSANPAQSGYNSGEDEGRQSRRGAEQQGKAYGHYPIYAPRADSAEESASIAAANYELSSAIYAPNHQGQNVRQSAAEYSYAAAQSGAGMADRRYTDEGMGQQPYPRGGENNHPDAGRLPPRGLRGAVPQAAVPRQEAIARAPQREEPQAAFAEEAVYGGLGGADSSLQPAHFDPSDYDYGYETAPAQEPMGGQDYSYPPQEQAGGGAFAPASPQQGRAAAPQSADAAYYGENYMPAAEEAYYPEQAYNYAPQEQHFAAPQQNLPPHYDNYAPYERDEAPYRQNAAAEAAHMFPAEEGYPAEFDGQSGSAQFAAPAHAESFPPAYADEAQVFQGNLPQELYQAPYEETAFADDSVLPFDAPYAQEDELISADFGRLNADAANINRIAGSYPPAGAAAQFPHGAEAGFAAAPAAGHGANPASQGEYYEQAEDIAPYAEAGPFPAEDGQHETAMRAAPAASGAEFANEALGANRAYEGELYDWAAPAAVAGAAIAPQRRGDPHRVYKKSRKLWYFLAFSALIALAGIGAYWQYGHVLAESANIEPIIIHKSAEAYKVKPQGASQSNDNAQEQSVTEGVSNAAGAESGQKALIDKTEEPVEIQKMEERLPFSEEQKPFNQSAVDSFIRTVVAQAPPVHIVPSVKVNAERKITASAGGGEAVLIPGAAVNYISAAPASAAIPLKTAEPAAKPAPLHAAETAPPKPQKSAASPVKAQSAAAAGSGFFMQISSQPSREAAERSLREAQKYLDPAIAGKMVIVAASIPDKGTYYRVRIPAESREEARRLCDAYKQAGGHCFVAR